MPVCYAHSTERLFGATHAAMLPPPDGFLTMLTFFQTWNFLTLALLFSLPGALIYLLRSDLRTVIARVVPFALPFAFTEFLFYPAYWEPVFLFGLGSRIGFGIEDFLFVAGLAAFSSTVYAACRNRTYAPCSIVTARACADRALLLFALAGALLACMLAAGIAVIYAACLAMLAAGLTASAWRRDLAAAACIGAVLAAAVYFAVCLLAGLIMPGIFQTVWHTEKFLGVFVAGVPLEELAYAGAAGFAATVFYPYVFGLRFVRRKIERHA